jgi:hypothetical protein
MVDGQAVRAPFRLDITEAEYNGETCKAEVELETCDSEDAPVYHNAASKSVLIDCADLNSGICNLQYLNRLEDPPKGGLHSKAWERWTVLSSLN